MFLKQCRMFGLFNLVFVSYVLLFAIAESAPVTGALPSEDLLGSYKFDVYARADPLDSWIDAEYDIAVSRLLDNVAPGGQNALGTAPGTVIASPSKDTPDYFYQCETFLSAVSMLCY